MDQGEASAHTARRDRSPVSTRQGWVTLPYQAIAHLVREGQLFADASVEKDQIQPASIDLRLGHVAYRVRASFLPGPDATVQDRINQLDGYPIDLTNSAVLERGCVYVVPLLESARLTSGIVGFANPKSSTGRLDVLTRLITDRSVAFDQVAKAYEGPLYVEVAPRAFSIVVRTGSRLNQLRFRRGSVFPMPTGELNQLHGAGKLVNAEGGIHPPSNGRVGVTIDLIWLR